MSDPLQRREARQEIVRAAAHEHELRNFGRATKMRLGAGSREAVRPVGRVADRRDRGWFAISEQWVLFPAQSGEFRVREPCALNELELARDVRVEADELQPRLRVGGRGIERGRAVNPFPVLAAAPENAMEARRGDRIVLRAQVGPHRGVLRPGQRRRCRLRRPARR